MRTGPPYLEGRLGNEEVEITNRRGDIHRNRPLLLRQGFGGLWRRYSCGCFLQKPWVGVIKITVRELSITTLPKRCSNLPLRPNQASQPTPPLVPQ